jgi:excisionase family DNA binding protein
LGFFSRELPTNEYYPFEVIDTMSSSLQDRVRQLTGKITVKRLADVLEIHPITLYRWVESNKIPYTRLGRSIQFDPARIVQWLEFHSIAAGS